jgi:hypothetical protein
MRVYCQDLDAYKGDADVDIDYEALVQDGVDDVSEAAGRGAVKIAVARLGRDGDESTPGSSLTGPWLLRLIECKPSTGCHGARAEVFGLVYPVPAPAPQTDAAGGRSPRCSGWRGRPW